MDFLGQFLSQVWPLVTFIVVMIVLYVVTLFWMRQRRQQRIRDEKERIAQNSRQPEPEAQLAADEQPPAAPARDVAKAAAVAPPVTATTSDIDDDDDDPLAELYAARAEAQAETAASPPAPEPNTPQLGELLGQAAVPPAASPQDYHRVADGRIQVKLATGGDTGGRELLSIVRDMRDDRLMILLGGTAFRTLADDKDAKLTFTTVMKELQGVILKPDDNPAAQTSSAAPASDYLRVADGRIQVKLATGGDTIGRELLSIVRDDHDRRLMILLGGTAFRTLADDKDAKLTFTTIMKELSGVILKPDDNPPPLPSVAASTAPAASQPTVSEPSPSVDDELDEPHDEVARSVAAAQMLEDEEILPGDIRIKSMDEMDPGYEVGRFGRIKVKPPEQVEDISIAEAIEAYLQYKISQTPEFQRRGIHIRQSRTGGVIIDAEGTSYDFVDDVSDPAVRDFIKQAIAEWQERQG